MPGATPILAFPYPLGTDPISDGDDQIKALAERVETIMVGGPSTTAPWNPIALTGGGSDIGGGYRPLAYRKIGNVVYCRGGISGLGGGLAAGTVMFTFGAGFRPTGKLMVPVAGTPNAGGGFCVKVTVDTAGACALAGDNGIAVNGFVIFDALYFLTD